MKLKKGDIVIARAEFMHDYPHHESRRLVVESFRGFWAGKRSRGEIKLVNYANPEQIYFGSYCPDYFYYFDDVSINKEIYDSLDRYEFKSFQGVTLEGKIIQFDLPVPFSIDKLT